MRFEWDEAKNLANQRKHGISFEQALYVFAVSCMSWCLIGLSMVKSGGRRSESF